LRPELNGLFGPGASCCNVKYVKIVCFWTTKHESIF